MSTDRDTTPHTAQTRDVAVNAPNPDLAPDDIDTTATTAQTKDEAMARQPDRYSDAVSLVPSFDLPPMRTPDHIWAMLVSAVDITGVDNLERWGEVNTFTGHWVEKTPADGSYEGDLVMRLTPPSSQDTASPTAEVTVDIEMLLAHNGQWKRVGCWRGLDDRWPHLVAYTAEAIMSLHIELT